MYNSDSLQPCSCSTLQDQASFAWFLAADQEAQCHHILNKTAAAASQYKALKCI